MDVINYLKINERISTSGQPKPEDFARIASEGFKTVINLALPTSDNAIPDEGAVVTRHGMNYFHIPVVWDAPRADQFHSFVALLDAHAKEKVWVHCALNMRVSCFMYLYHHKFAGMSETDARTLMERIWQPNEAWRKFMDETAATIPAK